MDQGELSSEILTDLFRSAWLIESSRAELYRRWIGSDPDYEAFADRSEQQAAIVKRALDAQGREPDVDLVAPHTQWMERTAGAAPDEVPFGALFVSRMGTWVEAHAADFLPEGGEKLRELGEEERAGLTFPEQMPAPPPFEPVVAPEVEPPGEVLFRFAILADLHFGSRHGDQFAQDAIEELNSSGADLVVQLGDITDHGGREEFESAAAALGKLELPLVTMMGNHDVLSTVEGRLTGREYYAAMFGREADGIILDHKGFRFAVLDSVEHASSPLPAFDFVAGRFIDTNAGAIVRGSLTPAQHDLLAQVAEPHAPPAFIFLHHPPQPFIGFPPVLFGLRDADSGRLHATIDSGNVWGVFAGHTHRNARSRDFDGVPAHEVAIPRDFPYGYALVDVSAEGYAFRFVQLSNEEKLKKAYASANPILRRYARGSDTELAWTWSKG